MRRLRYRFDDFEATTRREGLACSLKLRPQRGYFDRRCSPHAYTHIDRLLRERPAIGRWVEGHSNGPEVLAYLGVHGSRLGVTPDVVELLVVLANARAEGIGAGDKEQAPLDLIVRYFDVAGDYFEKRILEIADGAMMDEASLVGAFAAQGFAIEPQSRPR